MADALPIHDTLTLPGETLEVRSSRSGGPGGQHANTSDSRIQLWFDIEACDVLSGAVKARLRAQRPGWFTKDGRVLVTSDAHRSQHRNLEEVRDRLAEAVRGALRPPKRRRATRPTRSSQRRRVDNKKKRGATKKLRGKVQGD